MAEKMIEAEGLRRVYRNRKEEIEAVRGVDFTVDAGEIVGFLGPNGAGKTTTLRMLTTLLDPSAGRVRVAGHDLATDPVGCVATSDTWPRVAPRPAKPASERN